MADTQLLRGPYRAPALRRGDRAECLYRDGAVVITSWADARIPWPRCRALDTTGGGSGLLVDAELARAIRNESAAAIMHHWGVSTRAVWNWRKAFGVDLVNNPGTNRLVRKAATLGAAVMKRHEFTPAERAQRRRNAKRLGLTRNLTPGYHGPWWTRKQLALLERDLTDAEIGERIGRTENAVRVMRWKMERRS